MNLKDLKYITLLAEHRHFGDAAKAAFISQPTLSMQIKKLEEELGIEIFERSHKQVFLTQAGEAVVKQAKKVLEAATDLRDTAQNFKDPFGGVLKLGVFPSLAPYYFPRVVPKLKNKFPKLKLLLIENKTKELLYSLEEGTLDAAFLALPITENENDFLQSEIIFEEPFYLATPKDHALAKKAKASLNALSEYEILLLEDGHCMREQVLQLCKLANAKESIDFRATSLETLRQMVISNGAITLIPELAIDKKDKNIAYIPFSRPVPSRTIALVWRNTSTRSLLLRKIVEILK